MLALMKRNITLYFRNRVGMLMSLLGALISFFIYVCFLQNNLVSSWEHVSNIKSLLDGWMIGGILAITGLTTAFAVMGQLVNDRTEDVYWDFEMTALTPLKISLSYFGSTAFVSFIMQLIVFGIMVGYFSWQDNFMIDGNELLLLLLVTIINTIFSTIFSLLIVEFINTHTIYSRVAAIIGTLVGFMVATYMPMGVLSVNAQRFIKLFPGAYIAASYREILTKHYIINDFPQNMRPEFTKFLGIKLSITRHLLTNSENLLLVLGASLLGLILFIVINHLKYKRN
ncbi:ABC transporter permease [Lactobacillaceae bacterium 24-114]